jgi:magnesium transporter
VLKKLKYKDLTWLDLESPQADEIASLAKEFDLHPLVSDELIKPSAHSKVDYYQNYTYIVLHFPHTKPNGVVETQEIDFVIGKDFIITTHYELLNSLNDFAKIFESDVKVKRETTKLSAGSLFFFILKEIYAGLSLQLNYTNDQLKKVESKVFSGQERQVVSELALINRSILNFRWALKPHQEILNYLDTIPTEFFGPELKPYLLMAKSDEQRVWNMVEANRSTFRDLQSTNESLLTTRTNETIRVLTVSAFIFLPLSILSQIFSMNTISTPIVGMAQDFYIVLSLMALVVLGLYFLARWRRWL